MATPASSPLPLLLRRRLAEDTPTFYRKFKHWIVHTFLPFWVSVAIAMWGVFFTLQHPEILISIVGPTLAAVAAPVVILVVCFYANWWLYSISVPKTFSHWHGLIKSIRKEGWSRLSVARVVALVLTGSYVLIMGPTFFASLTTMLPIYAKLLGLGLTINPIGLGIAAGIIVAIVSLTTLCLLFDHFDDLVRLLFNPEQKTKRAKAWRSFIQNFQPQKTGWLSVVLTCLLLALSVFISVGAAAAVVAAAAPHMILLLKFIGFAPATASITVAVLAYGMALASRLPFALKGLAQIALSIRDTLINIKPVTIYFFKELNRRRLIVIRAKGMRLAALQRYWLVPVWQFGIVAPINAFTSFCTGLSGSKALGVPSIGLGIVSGTQTGSITISGVQRVNNEKEKSSAAAILKELTAKKVPSSDDLFNHVSPEHIALQEIVLRYAPTLKNIIAAPGSTLAANWLTFAGSTQCSAQSNLQHKLYVFTAQSELARWAAYDSSAFANNLNMTLNSLVRATDDGLLMSLLSIRLICASMTAEQLKDSFHVVIDVLAQQALNSEACISARSTAIAIAEQMKAQRVILYNDYMRNCHTPLVIGILADDQDKLSDALDAAMESLTHSSAPSVINAALKTIYLLIVDINVVPESLLELLAQKLHALDDDVIIPFLKHLVPHLQEVNAELFVLVLNRLSRNTKAYKEILSLMAPKIDELMFMDPDSETIDEGLFDDLSTRAETDPESDFFLGLLVSLPAKILNLQQQQHMFDLVARRMYSLSRDSHLNAATLDLLTTLTNNLTSVDSDLLKQIIALMKAPETRTQALTTLLAFGEKHDAYNFTPLLTPDQRTTLKQAVLDSIHCWDSRFSEHDINQLRTLAIKLDLNWKNYQQWCDDQDEQNPLFHRVAARVLGNKSSKQFDVDDIIISKCQATLEQAAPLTTRYTALCLLQQLAQGEQFIEKQTVDIALAAIKMIVQEKMNRSDDMVSWLTILSNTIHGVNSEKLKHEVELAPLRQTLRTIITENTETMSNTAANVLVVLQAKIQDDYCSIILATEAIKNTRPDSSAPYRLKLIMNEMKAAEETRKQLYRTLVKQFNALVSDLTTRHFLVGNTAGLFPPTSPAINLLRQSKRPQTMAAIETILLAFLNRSKPKNQYHCHTVVVQELNYQNENVSDEDIQVLYRALEDCNQLRKSALDKLFSFVNRHKETHDYYQTSTHSYETAVRHLSISASTATV